MSSSVRRLAQRVHDRVFQAVHQNNLIYNLCWEDPRLDRQVLQLDADSQVVMLTSAGCNALDYLLDNPAAIHAVDLNSRQNALLELKRAALLQLEHSQLFALFGNGASAEYATLYQQLRPQLPQHAQLFWDKAQRYFDPKQRKRSFYYHGTSGTVAWVLTRYLRRRASLRQLLDELAHAPDLATQRALYQRMEPELWGRFSRWLLRQPMTMAMLGVPRAQIRLMSERNADGVLGYIQSKLRHLFCEVPFQDNYFWQVYLNGQFSPQCCPEYLRAPHQPLLRERLARLHTHTNSLSGFLRTHPGQYSHYVLLDHQDWLAWHEPQALREEWELILANSRPGTRIILRSAGLEVDFIPPDILARLRVYPEITAPLHRQDRVGTYGSFYLFEVQP